MRFLAAIVMLAIALPASAEFIFRQSVPVRFADPSAAAPAELDWSLRATTLPRAHLGAPYSFDFSRLIESNRAVGALDWSAENLPSWGALGASSGVLSGAPEMRGEVSFTVTASHAEEGDREQVYTIMVGGERLLAKSVSSGDDHACAVTLSGFVKCWGNNASGQLGNGTNTDSPTPVRVIGIYGDAVSVDVGYQYSCALLANSTVRCWGRNDYGQLANGNVSYRNKALETVNLSRVSSLSAGRFHVCVLRDDGDAHCWGRNLYGEAGQRGAQIGGSETTTSPSMIRDFLFSSISAEGTATCGIATDGGVYCWGNPIVLAGSNDPAIAPFYSDFEENEHVPHPVYGLSSGITSVATGISSACAIRDAGDVVCWGDIGNTLGATSTFNNLTPMTGVHGVTQVRVGANHGCALNAAGAAWCFGSNGSGQLGPGNTSGTPSGLAAVAVSVDGGLSSVSPSVQDFTCGIRRSNSAVVCWGSNASGQLGDGTTANQSVPTVVEHEEEAI